MLFRSAIVIGILFTSWWYINTGSARTPVVEVLPQYDYVIASTTPIANIAGYAVIDIVTGELLLTHQVDTLRPLASVVKLFLAPSFLSLIPAATTTITAADLAAPEDFGGLVVGEVYTGRELLFPYLLTSSNDAAHALSRLSNDAWRAAFTTQRDSLGIAESDLAIVDPAGLAVGTAATPRAAATFLRHLFLSEPHIFDQTILKKYCGPYHCMTNNSPVLDTAGYRGGKHGYTQEAGRTLVAVIATPFPDGARDVGFVILGTDDTKAALKALQAQVATAVTRVDTSAILPASVNE